MFVAAPLLANTIQAASEGRSIEEAAPIVGNIFQILSEHLLGGLNVVIDYFTTFYQSVINACKIIFSALGFLFAAEPLLPLVVGTGIMVFVIVGIIRFLMR